MKTIATIALDREDGARGCVIVGETVAGLEVQVQTPDGVENPALPAFSTMAEAVAAIDASWGRAPCWDLQWEDFEEGSMKATHTLAFVGDALIAVCPIGQNIAAEIEEACPSDVAEAWKTDPQVFAAWLSPEEVEGADCLFSVGPQTGDLPDGARYAYRPG